MTLDITDPAEALRSIQDSIRSAETAYDHEPITWATDKQVMGINIAIERALKDFDPGREDRVNTLRVLFGRLPGRFNSSKDMSLKGALALRDRIYGPDAIVDRDSEILPDALLGIIEAYRQATGQLALL